MQSSSFHFLPPLFLLLAVVLAAVVVVLQIGILGYAYEKMGVSRRAAYLILLASLVGSYFNLPVAEIPAGERNVGTKVLVDPWFGTRSFVPVVERWPATSIALNVGGAIVPTLLSIYLVIKNHIFAPAVLGTAAVGAVVHMLAYPVPQMGIAVPVLIPPIVSALVAMFLSRDYAAPLAYVSGCLGTLIGADLMNLGELGRLGASIASIGGAGTFDGVFLTGVLAVLLAGKPQLPRHESQNNLADDPASGHIA